MNHTITLPPTSRRLKYNSGIISCVEQQPSFRYRTLETYIDCRDDPWCTHTAARCYLRPRDTLVKTVVSHAHTNLVLVFHEPSDRGFLSNPSSTQGMPRG
uniref:Uncharacterized protein n=1 Tax=Arundo donax TaxID=35708 RepID=A0A0A9D8R9_ARUDO